MSYAAAVLLPTDAAAPTLHALPPATFAIQAGSCTLIVEVVWDTS
jgi:hypothetical protein